MEQNTSSKASLIEEVKRRLSLDDLFSKYNVKKGTGKNSYYCPFHDDKTPSFVASNDKGWKCLSNPNCGSGDQISFIQKIENLSFEEALVKASNIANIAIEEKKGKTLINELEEKHLNYLLNRGITKKSTEIFALKSKGDYILFPQKREEKINGYKAINIFNKKMFFDGKDKSSKLFPDYNFEGVKTVIFTAGEYDCIYLTQKILELDLNEYKVVSNSTGEGSFPKDLDRLKQLETIEKFMIFYDHDDTGKNGAKKLAKELAKLEKPIEIYYFPENKKEKYDVSDFFNEGNSLDDLFNLEKTVYKVEENNRNIDYIDITKLANLKFNFSTLNNNLLDSLEEFDFITPIDYQISENGVNKIVFTLRDEKIDEVSKLPILITEQAINTDHNVVSLILAFKRNGEWKKETVEREVICDAKKITSLCNSGFPVHTGNAKKIVEYLHAFEIANLSIIKTVYLTHNNGWKKIKKQKAFGLGENIIGLEEGEANISFSPEIGFERFTKALNVSGSYSDWLTQIEPLMKNKKIAFSIYASLAAPLLSLVDCSSFLIHFWGDSSMGKTTVMEIASSVWGNPAKESGGLVTSWNNTMVFVERLASFFNDLPMFLDDSQTADDKSVSKIMYMIGNSTGKGRGKKAGGIDSNKSWHTVCFSTGEKQLTESTQYDGAKARTIEFNGSPFGRNEGKIVNDIKTCVRENYGQIGNMFIKQLMKDLEDPEKLIEYKEAYKTFRELLSMKASNEIGNRMAHYFSVIQLAGTLIEDYFHLGGNVFEVIEDCFLEALNERKTEGDTSTRALNDVLSYAQANMKSFMGKSDDFIREHYGVWKENEYIAFYPHKLKDVLTKAGFSYNSIIRSWSDRDWLKKELDRSTFKISFNNQKFRMITIRWEAIQNII